MIVAQTFKGKHMPEQENMDNWHGKPMKKEAFEKIKSHLDGLKQDTDAKVEPQGPAAKCDNMEFSGGMKLSSPPSYQMSDKIATRAGKIYYYDSLLDYIHSIWNCIEETW